MSGKNWAKNRRKRANRKKRYQELRTLSFFQLIKPETGSNPSSDHGRDQSSNSTGLNPSTDHYRDQSSNCRRIPGNEHDSTGPNPAMNQQRVQSSIFWWGAANNRELENNNFDHTGSNP